MKKQCFWAKKTEDRGQLKWLPLEQHLEDTRCVIGLLWEHWLTKGQKDFLVKSMSFGDEDLAKSLMQFLAAVHDIGKATPAFQTKTGFQNSPDLDKTLLERLEAFGFQGIQQFDTRFARNSPHALAGQYILSGYGLEEGLASIIGGHHGRPIDERSLIKNQVSYLSNYYQVEDVNHSIYGLWQAEQQKIFDWALKINGFDSVEDLPQVSQEGQFLISGLLIMADWLASNEYYFPLLPLDQMACENQDSRIQSGWKAWFKTTPIESLNHPSVQEMYDARFEFKPRGLQEKMANLIEGIEEPGLIILEAPMGEGKTEAALIAAEQLMQKSGRTGIFFGLPTQATSNGIFPRILRWLNRWMAKSNDKVSVQLVHGKAALNQDFDGLKHGQAAYNHNDEVDAENINIDENGSMEETVMVNQWFTGKKTAVLDDFVVGTVDQFLMTALKQKHLALRHLGFSRKVVIIDEVHAYDAYMDQYLTEALVWMGAYQVPVIILSATLPVKKRQDFIQAYMTGKGVNKKNLQLPEEIDSSDYPLITYSEGQAIKVFNQFDKSERSLTVTIKKIEETELVNHLKFLMAKKGIIGVVVNTVRRAQELADQCIDLFGKDKVSLLHSNFVATHRLVKEKSLMDEIGKKGKRPESKLYIGTQVIEQSLDIDFDCLVSELAPMDLLIQRAGRLHRHDIVRPEGFKEPVMYVLGTSSTQEFDSGSVAIYGEYLLAKTQYYLPDSMFLPEDISPLVQQVYQEDTEERFLSMKEGHDNRIKDKTSRAQKFRIENPHRSGPINKKISLIGFLKNTHPDQSESYAYAQVRDTQETIEVILLKDFKEGYSYINGYEDISNCIHDSVVAKRLAQETITLPRVLSKPYMINDTIKELEVNNLRRLKDWQKQPWLKGSLGLILNSNNETVLNGYKLRYNTDKGLTYERVNTSE